MIKWIIFSGLNIASSGLQKGLSGLSVVSIFKNKFFNIRLLINTFLIETTETTIIIVLTSD